MLLSRSIGLAGHLNALKNEPTRFSHRAGGRRCWGFLASAAARPTLAEPFYQTLKLLEAYVEPRLLYGLSVVIVTPAHGVGQHHSRARLCPRASRWRTPSGLH